MTKFTIDPRRKSLFTRVNVFKILDPLSEF
jgi:hypothetical protein